MGQVEGALGAIGAHAAGSDQLGQPCFQRSARVHGESSPGRVRQRAGGLDAHGPHSILQGRHPEGDPQIFIESVERSCRAKTHQVVVIAETKP